jgi:UDP-N-acetylglucosamine 4-epimerase
MYSAEIKNSSFLITGGAGFIGSNLCAYLIQNGAKSVRVLDNLSTGYLHNIQKYIVSGQLEFIEGDIRDKETCRIACIGIDYVSNQAALGSVPRSVKDPQTTNEVNIDGFLNMLVASRDAGVKRFVFASSSSVYGDNKDFPKQEDKVGNLLSPYAVTKKVNELYADVFGKTYEGFEYIGLRYFNIFGPQQSPEGEYAALIPLFIKSVIQNKSPFIHGDGEQGRDFTYIDNAVQANVKSFFTQVDGAVNQVYNIACGERITVNSLFEILKETAQVKLDAVYTDSRKGDIRDSLANISKAQHYLGYEPTVHIQEGLKKTLEWFVNQKYY